MKRSRDDAIAMGDNNSYEPLREGAEDDDEEEYEQEERAACDVLLSLSCGSSSSTTSSCEEAPAGTAAAALNNGHRPRRRRGQAAFECRTCGREFATFQALGGHRTSHLRLRRRPAAAEKLRLKAAVVVHACGTCGLGFSTGQALGGHMRRHRGDSGYVGLTQQIVMQERPRSASLQLLNLFV